MDSKSRQNLFNLLRNASREPISVFTDLDMTSCEEGNKKFAEQNKETMGVDKCYMNPDIAQSLTKLPEYGCDYYIVTGRHWSDFRENDLTGEKIPDGAFHDLLGGAKAFENANVVAGHGRLVVEEGKTKVLHRSNATDEEVLKEQKFERYIGENVLKLKKELFEKWPESKGVILAEYKKHLSYINVSEYQKLDPKAGEAMAKFVDKKMQSFMNDENAPENPNGALMYCVEPTGSMEVRSKNQSKRNGLEQSGFLQKAYDRGGLVLVMGDSLGKNGTDRDMVSCVRDFFNERGAGDRVVVMHVQNSPEKKLTDVKDPCYPDIAFENVDELGKALKLISGQAKVRYDCRDVLAQEPPKPKKRTSLTYWSQLNNPRGSR
ncbi:MAG: hypothetical protein MJ247_05880 [Alphaproteobacteria bacterium]|nr:hypothetical protein [Alphaproteobacteria bacterium]